MLSSMHWRAEIRCPEARDEQGGSFRVATWKFVLASTDLVIFRALLEMCIRMLCRFTATDPSF
jgi:hypothetical protein